MISPVILFLINTDFAGRYIYIAKIIFQSVLSVKLLPNRCNLQLNFFQCTLNVAVNIGQFIIGYAIRG